MIIPEAVLFFVFASCFSLTLQAQERPNVLFVLSDDQRWDSLGCYGNSVIKTPNLDRLAADGARLDAFFVAAPVCCPSRAVFLSGLYPSQTGLISNTTGDLPDYISTVADYFNASGYVTGFVGKAHLGGYPKKWGFKQVPVFLPVGQSVHENPSLVVNNRKRKMTGHITTIFADAAIKFIESNKDNRWFLWLATTLPHLPLFQDPNFPYRLSPFIAPPGWPTTQELGTSQNVLSDWNNYYSTIGRLDFEIGRILHRLEDLGLRNNTVVFFTSDNGLMMLSHGAFGKEIWFEESIRVPALIRWPGKIKPGTRVPFLLSSADFFPTLLEIAGTKTPGKREGKSMLPALLDHKPVRSAIFAEVEHGPKGLWKMVRTERWKFAREADGTEHLYDLHNDPHELMDMANSSAAAHTKLAMRTLMESSILVTSNEPFDWLSPLRFVVWWIHILTVVFWIGALYHLRFLSGKFNWLLKQSRSPWNEIVISSRTRTTVAGIAVALSGFALFYWNYLFGAAYRFQDYNGITIGGIWVLIGAVFSAFTFLFAIINVRALRNITGEQSLPSTFLTKRISFLASLNLCLGFAAMLSFVFASKNRPPTPKFLLVTGVLLAMTFLAVFFYDLILDSRDSKRLTRPDAD